MLIFAKGLLIGIANIIPGVSGGTFALVLGVYDRLINSLAAYNFEFLKNLSSPKKTWAYILKNDGAFIFKMGSGAIVSIALLSWLIDYLLLYHSIATLSFFMGLVLPSVLIPYKMIEGKKKQDILFVVPGIILVIFSYRFNVSASEPGLLFVFLSGAMAISAMILPGISGSFLLLVLGVYGEVVNNIKQFTSFSGADSILFLSVFALGCIFGLVLFVRLMKTLLVSFRDKTLYFLIGLVGGSVVVLWPFKIYPEVLDGKLDVAITIAANRAPLNFYELLWGLLFFTLGSIGVVGMSRLAKNKDK